MLNPHCLLCLVYSIFFFIKGLSCVSQFGKYVVSFETTLSKRGWEAVYNNMSATNQNWKSKTSSNTLSVHTRLYNDPLTKHRKNCKSCPTQVTWKIKFKCEICLFCLSCVPWVSCLSWSPWWSSWRLWRSYKHDIHDYHDDPDSDNHDDHVNYDDFDDHADLVHNCTIFLCSLDVGNMITAEFPV